MKNPGPAPLPKDRLDRAWAVSLIQWIERFFRSLPGVLEAQSEFITRQGRRKHVTNITAATYTILLSDEHIDVNRAGVVTLTLPDGPALGQSFSVQDGSGGASGNTITIAKSASYNVNGTSSVTITSDYGRMDIIFNGTEFTAG